MRIACEDRRVSWDEAFAERYDEWAADMTADVPFYVSLAEEADGPVVELAVGTGRVAAPVARAIGRTVIGIDLSPAMLAQARELDADLDLRLGDMRELELDEPAALVYCPYRALLHLPTWADRRRIRSGTPSATTGSTSSSTAARRRRSGGGRGTSGWG